MPCNLRVARQRATQHNAAMEGAVGIAEQEATEWGRWHGHPRLDRGGHCGRTHGRSRPEAATAQIKGEVEAADEEARLTQEAIACKEAEVKALEEALAQEREKDVLALCPRYFDDVLQVL